MGEVRGIRLVARDGDALEEQAVAPGHAEGGVVWRWEVLRGVEMVRPLQRPHLFIRPRLTFVLQLLQILTEDLLSFGTFGKCFCKNSFSSLPTYKEAMYQIIEVTHLSRFWKVCFTVNMQPVNSRFKSMSVVF